MRRLVLAAVLLLALPVSLSAATYDSLRASNPLVAQSISRLPSNGIGGTLNRISSLLEQKRVADLAAGEGASLPAGFDRQMSSALEQLERDLARSLPAVQIADRLIIAQVVAEVAFARNVELPAGQRSMDVLERIADQVAGSVRDGLVEHEHRTGQDLSAARTLAADDPAAASFPAWVQDVVGASLYI